jgi:hypothetical protein
MLILNLENIENLIFHDSKLRSLMPDLHHIFDQWLMAQRIPYLRSLRLRSLMDLLNNLNDEHIALLSSYFQDSVVLTKLDYHIVRNFTVPINEFERELNQLDSSFQNMTISRDEGSLYISFWR